MTRGFMPEFYEILVKGHLDQRWSDWFTGMELTHLENDGTRISGVLPDQAALYGLLEHIRDLNLTLISVNCVDQSSSSLKKSRVFEKGTADE